MEGTSVGEIANTMSSEDRMTLEKDLIQEGISIQDADEVRTLAHRAHEMGIDGVPFFIYNRAIGMSGAHPPQDILLAINQALALQ